MRHFSFSVGRTAVLSITLCEGDYATHHTTALLYRRKVMRYGAKQKHPLILLHSNPDIAFKPDEIEFVFRMAQPLGK
ncbi:hypothetical protein [Photobacterium kagoshimensis]|uniref:hypothetical protein n=1 Tax=Photobacterium kagoshimensis TaxID=2910242 RepID=UPI003D11378A